LQREPAGVEVTARDPEPRADEDRALKPHASTLSFGPTRVNIRGALL
jgi:hypothetical protein